MSLLRRVHQARALLLAALVACLSAGLIFALVEQAQKGDREATKEARSVDVAKASEKLQEVPTLAAVIEYARDYGYMQVLLRVESAPTFYQFGIDDGPGIVPTLQDPETGEALPFSLFAAVDQQMIQALPAVAPTAQCRALVGYAHVEVCRPDDRQETDAQVRVLRLDLQSKPQA